jgi:hypothetical protein
MRSSFEGTFIPPYIGVDLSDRYANQPRPVDVCGLTPVANGGAFDAKFWQWAWPTGGDPLVVQDSRVLHEVLSATAVMIDGTQGLASPGRTARQCEVTLNAAGKTPSVLPPLGVPYAGFMRSSVDLFAAFHALAIPIGPVDHRSGVSEVYPASLWIALSPRPLPQKKTREGRVARRVLLERLGVRGLPDAPSHDENDACVSALIAAAACGEVAGLGVRNVGLPAQVEGGVLREGWMVVPVLSEELSARLREATPEVRGQPPSQLQQFSAQPQQPPAEPQQPLAEHQQPPTGEEVLSRANRLLVWLASLVHHGVPRVCTYGDVYRHLFRPPQGWSFTPNNISDVLRVASHSTAVTLPELGPVLLDTFIVNSATLIPGDQHWAQTAYDTEDWGRVFAGAELLEIYPQG